MLGCPFSRWPVNGGWVPLNVPEDIGHGYCVDVTGWAGRGGRLLPDGQAAWVHDRGLVAEALHALQPLATSGLTAVELARNVELYSQLAACPGRSHPAPARIIPQSAKSVTQCERFLLALLTERRGECLRLGQC